MIRGAAIARPWAIQPIKRAAMIAHGVALKPPRHAQTKPSGTRRKMTEQNYSDLMREVEALRKENTYLRERRFVGFWNYCIAEKGFCRCALCKALGRFPEWRVRP